MRIAGDMYQWLVAWRGCVIALQERDRHEPNPVVGVGVEVDGVGNLDDVVLHRAGAPDTYCQVKYASDATQLVNEEYLLAPSRTGGPPILAKIAAAWQGLTADTAVDLVLVTTRAIDPGDPLTSGRDTRTSLLMPKAARKSAGSDQGKARARWAAAVGMTEAELLDLLSVLRFETALDPQRLCDQVALQMRGAGLRGDDEAVAAGADWIARQVRDGHMRLELTDIDRAIVSLQLHESSAPPIAVSAVGAIRVAEADPVLLGVHRPINVPGAHGELPAYVVRDTDITPDGLHAAIKAAVQRGGFVLLVGGSSVGKTRCLYEALRELIPDWWLLHPDTASDLEEFSADPRGRVVVWLDELQRYLDGGLGLGTVRGLLQAAGPVLLVGTLWPKYYTTYATPFVPDSSGAGDPHVDPRAVLELAEVVRLPAELTTAERERAERLAESDLRIQAALELSDYGLTQTMAAAPELIGRWRDADPYASAVLNTAIDATRFGVRSPLSTAFLQDAAHGYCEPRAVAAASGNWFQTAMDYATATLRGAAAALTATSPPGGRMGEVAGYIVADYLVQHAGRHRETELGPASLWDALISHITDPGDCYRLAEAAYRRGLYRLAATLYKEAASKGDTAAPLRLLQVLYQLRLPSAQASTWVAQNTALDDPPLVVELLKILKEHNDGSALATLADRAARGVALQDPRNVAGLLVALRQTGSEEAATHLLSRDPAQNIAVHDPTAVAVLLKALLQLRETDKAKVLAFRAAQHTALDEPYDLAELLPLLNDIAGQDAVETLVARDPANHPNVDDPGGVAVLLRALQRLRETDKAKVLAFRAAQHTALDEPYGLAELLPLLNDIAGQDAVETLVARDPANHASVDDPDGVMALWDALSVVGADEAAADFLTNAIWDCPDRADIHRIVSESGEDWAIEQLWEWATEQVMHDDVSDIAGVVQVLSDSYDEDTLTDLMQHMPIESPFTVAEVLQQLRELGEQDAEAELLTRDLAQQAAVDDLRDVAQLLTALDQAGEHDAAATLASRASQVTSLDDPSAVAQLLTALDKIGEHDVSSALAHRAAQEAPLYDPGSLAQLLTALRQMGDRQALSVLLARDPAQHVLLEDSDGVAQLLDALHSEGRAYATEILANRSGNAGRFSRFLELGTPRVRERFRYGREPGGEPTPPWGWADLV